MDKLDDDEVSALVVSGILALITLIGFYAQLFSVTALARTKVQRWVAALTPPLCLLLLQLVLRCCSAHEVRDATVYDVLFLVGGAGWVGITIWLMPLAGLSVRRDVVEARNPGATVAACGAMLGVMLCYAGSNMGEGATIWTTFLPAILSTGALLGIWMLHALLCGCWETVAIDRDAASGIRLAGLLVACGLILGRASAGDWVSLDATVRDLVVQGAPAIALTAAATIVHLLLRPRRGQPFGSLATACAVAGAYVLSAVGYVVLLGPLHHARTGG